MASGGAQGRVYPRGCGGTPSHAFLSASPAGLSPRVRGNRLYAGPPLKDGGSIPAGAGEPCAISPGVRALAVYPRGCGGTVGLPQNAQDVLGLSPRVRGNLIRVERPEIRAGSIPAGAGEPALRHRVTRLRRVYPRGCGGTRAAFEPDCDFRGLSPRVRGNLFVRSLSRSQVGSIPAGAGEPHSASRRSRR